MVKGRLSFNLITLAYEKMTKRQDYKPPRARFERRGGNKHAAKRGTLTASEFGIKPHEWAKIKEAWSYEWPDTKACDYAGIGLGKLRVAYDKDPELRKKRDMIKSQGHWLAQKNVVQSLENGDIQTTRWFLERRNENYSQKGQVDVNITHSLNETQIIERLARFLSPAAIESVGHTVEDVPNIDSGAADGAVRIEQETAEQHG